MTQTVTPLPPLMSSTKQDNAQAFLQAFAQRYGDHHLRLAYHAAFPLALTSDLLYRLWGTLCNEDTGTDDPIPYGAVAKLLVGTGLCRTVGNNLYQIDPDLRQTLLNALEADPRFGVPRLQDLAAFTLSYADQQQHHPDPMVRDFAQVQRWGALAYCHTPQAAQELAQALSHAYATDRDDLYRMAKVVLTLADPLKDYPTLIAYARGMERLACDDEAGAREHLKDLLQIKHALTVEGVTLPLPALQPDPESRKPRSESPSNWVKWLWVGVSVLTLLVLFGVGSVWIQKMMEARNGTVANQSQTPDGLNTPSPIPPPSPPASPDPKPSPSPVATPPLSPPESPVSPNPAVTNTPPLTSGGLSDPSPIPTAPPAASPSPEPSPSPVALPPAPSPEPSVSPAPELSSEVENRVEGTPGAGDTPIIGVEPDPTGAPGNEGTVVIRRPADDGTPGADDQPDESPPSPEPSEPSEPLPPELDQALTPLRTSLQRRDFRQADRQTFELLIALGDTDESGWLSREEMENLSCEAIRAIDREWLRESGGRFGFSVQARIWREVGSPDPLARGEVAMQQWLEFHDRVGWHTIGSTSDQLQFNLQNSPAGSLPLRVQIIETYPYGGDPEYSVYKFPFGPFGPSLVRDYYMPDFLPIHPLRFLLTCPNL